MSVSSIEVRPFTDLRYTDVLRVIDLHVFPVRYQNSYYNRLAEYPSDISHLAFFGGVPVGSLTSRLEDRNHDLANQVCYIMTLGVLQPYRHKGIARRLVKALIAAVEKRPEVCKITLNVQVGSPALEFYEKLGFVKVGDIVKDYYTELDCNDAHVVEYEIKHVPAAAK